MEAHTDISALLRAMWEIRACGDMPSALERYLKIAGSLRVIPSEPLAKQAKAMLARAIGESDVIDFLLFRPSELRFLNRVPEAEEATREVEAIAESLGVPHHFQLLFQRGLNALVQSEFGSALSDFTWAISQARSTREAMSSRLNAILCLESMGYDFEEKLVDFLRDWRKVEVADAPWMSSVRQQLLPLRMRRAFATGDTKELRKLSRMATASRQGAYYAALVGELPYFDWSERSVIDSLKRSLTEQISTYQTKFRLGTLQGSLVRADFDEERRIGDKIERFYAWVWRWLVHPEPEILERLGLWWQHLSTVLTRHEVGKDEFLLLENGARWLGLFAGYEDQSIRSCLARFRSHSTTRPVLLDYEAQLIAFAFSLRDNLPKPMLSDEWENLLAHPANAFEAYLLPRTVASRLRSESTDDKPDPNSLAAFVAALRQFSRAPAAGPSIEIDLLGQELVLSDHDGARKTCASASLLKLVLAGQSRTSVPIYEVLGSCFGIHRYDPVIHDPKISQLLSLANRSLRPRLSFSRKGDQIRIERGKGGAKIRLVGGPIHVAQIYPWRERLAGLARRQDCAGGALHSRPARASEKTIALPSPGAWVNRQCLEAWLNTSRATACRRISAWVNEGLLHKRGVGRSTEYRLTQSLLSSKFLGVTNL